MHGHWRSKGLLRFGEAIYGYLKFRKLAGYGYKAT